MRALVIQGSRIEVETIAEPIPSRGQILLSPKFSGICGSDLHMLRIMKEIESATPVTERHKLPKIVPGHEFSGTFVDAGPGVESGFKPGQRLTAIPFSPGRKGEAFTTIGLSPHHSGGMADYCLVDATRVFTIPDSVPDDLAALTEPLAVGLHAANLANRNLGPNIVIGCGPVGLALILALKSQGRGPILAADFSQTRRDTALLFGADSVVDPASDSPYSHWQELQFEASPPSPLLARAFSGYAPGSNLFDCVGAPGIIDQLINNAPQHSHIVVVGVCAHEDKLTPISAINREVTLEFSFAYKPVEFLQSLALIEKLPDLVRHMITTKLGLDDAKKALEEIAGANDQIKVLVEPGLCL